MNEYEKARQRFEAISQNFVGIIQAAQKTIDDAYQEYDDAWADLRQYEKVPGVPLDRYNENTTNS